MPHIHEKIDFTAEALIVYAGKVLLRMHDKYDLWLGVGGHIELNEDPNEAVRREAKEEVGLSIKLIGEGKDWGDGRRDLIPPRFLNRHRIDGGHEHISMIYFAVADTDQVAPSGSDRSDNWKWFTAEEVADPTDGILPSIRHYAEAALREV